MDLEKNKIFAAVLVAGIAAYSFGFASDIIFHEEEMEERAYFIDVPEDLASGAVVSAPSGPEPIAAFLAEADPAKGEKLSRACAACHTFNEGGADGVGPNLWSIVNKNVASSGFAYSEAMASKGGSRTFDELNHFLYKPKDYIEGTKMNYIGIKKPENRADVIAYLNTLSATPAPLPEVTEVKEEAVEEFTTEDAPVNEADPIAESVDPKADPEGITENPEDGEDPEGTETTEDATE